MEYVYIASVILGLFYAGYWTGYSGVRAGSHRVQGFPAILTGGIVTFTIWAAAQEHVRAPGAAVLVLYIAALFFLVFVFGLGQLLGGLVPLWVAKGPKRAGAVLATLFFPASLVGGFLYLLTVELAAEEAAKAAALADLQSRTHVGRFGDHDVRFPGLPRLELRHRCREGRSDCSTNFWSSPGFNGVEEGDVLALREVVLAAGSDPLAATARWCSTRPEQAGSLWCSTRDYGNIRLRLSKPVGDWTGWEEVAGPDPASRTFCFQSWNGHLCRMFFEVAPGIQAVVSGEADTRSGALKQAQYAPERAHEIWAALTSGTGARHDGGQPVE